MTMESDLIALLLADSAVSTLVSTRVEPGILPADVTLPSLVVREISGFSSTQTFAGTANYFNGTVQIDCWAEDYAGIKALREAVLDAVDGVATGSIKEMRVTLTLDVYEAETQQFREVVDVQVVYARP